MRDMQPLPPPLPPPAARSPRPLTKAPPKSLALTAGPVEGALEDSLSILQQLKGSASTQDTGYLNEWKLIARLLNSLEVGRETDPPGTLKLKLRRSTGREQNSLFVLIDDLLKGIESKKIFKYDRESKILTITEKDYEFLQNSKTDKGKPKFYMKHSHCSPKKFLGEAMVKLEMKALPGDVSSESGCLDRQTLTAPFLGESGIAAVNGPQIEMIKGKDPSRPGSSNITSGATFAMALALVAGCAALVAGYQAIANIFKQRELQKDITEAEEEQQSEAMRSLQQASENSGLTEVPRADPSNINLEMEAASGSSSEEESLCEGDIVEIQGLTGKQELNGNPGEIVSKKINGRYSIYLCDEKKTVLVRPCNIKVILTAEQNEASSQEDRDKELAFRITQYPDYPIFCFDRIGKLIERGAKFIDIESAGKPLDSFIQLFVKMDNNFRDELHTKLAPLILRNLDKIPNGKLAKLLQLSFVDPWGKFRETLFNDTLKAHLKKQMDTYLSDENTLIRADTYPLCTFYEQLKIVLNDPTKRITETSESELEQYRKRIVEKINKADLYGTGDFLDVLTYRRKTIYLDPFGSMISREDIPTDERDFFVSNPYTRNETVSRFCVNVKDLFVDLEAYKECGEEPSSSSEGPEAAPTRGPVEAPAASSEEAASLRLGARVMIHGLTGKTELNGQIGNVVSGEKEGRYGVKLTGQKNTILIKRENLTEEQAPETEEQSPLEEEAAAEETEAAHAPVEAPVASSEEAASLREGARVRIHGLTGKTEFNGKLGKVVSGEKEGRFGVQVPDLKEPIAVKRENLIVEQVLSPASAPPVSSSAERSESVPAPAPVAAPVGEAAAPSSSAEGAPIALASEVVDTKKVIYCGKKEDDYPRLATEISGQTECPGKVFIQLSTDGNIQQVDRDTVSSLEKLDLNKITWNLPQDADFFIKLDNLVSESENRPEFKGIGMYVVAESMFDEFSKAEIILKEFPELFEFLNGRSRGLFFTFESRVKIKLYADKLREVTSLEEAPFYCGERVLLKSNVEPSSIKGKFGIVLEPIKNGEDYTFKVQVDDEIYVLLTEMLNFNYKENEVVWIPTPEKKDESRKIGVVFDPPQYKEEKGRWELGIEVLGSQERLNVEKVVPIPIKIDGIDKGALTIHEIEAIIRLEEFISGQEIDKSRFFPTYTIDLEAILPKDGSVVGGRLEFDSINYFEIFKKFPIDPNVQPKMETHYDKDCIMMTSEFRAYLKCMSLAVKKHSQKMEKHSSSSVSSNFTPKSKLALEIEKVPELDRKSAKEIKSKLKKSIKFDSQFYRIYQDKNSEGNFVLLIELPMSVHARSLQDKFSKHGFVSCDMRTETEEPKFYTLVRIDKDPNSLADQKIAWIINEYISRVYTKRSS